MTTLFGRMDVSIPSREEYNLLAVQLAYARGDIDVDRLEWAIDLILSGKAPPLPCCTPFGPHRALPTTPMEE